MVRHIYKKLTEEQKEKGIIFSSCLSPNSYELSDSVIHEVKKNDEDKWKMIERLTNDKFFNHRNCPYNYNIIRQ